MRRFVCFVGWLFKPEKLDPLSDDSVSSVPSGPSFFRQLLAREALPEEPEERGDRGASGAWGLLAGEPLAHDPAVLGNERPTGRGFIAWLFAREVLPRDPSPGVEVGPSIGRGLLVREQLPEDAGEERSRESPLRRLVAWEQLPRDPVIEGKRPPSIVRFILSGEQMDGIGGVSKGSWEGARRVGERRRGGESGF
ncbi:MAG: hypothetical protein HYY16_01845 [Planctomycetes bacterium]|nr:hypothetical protein [Planctomycetota bacterium]